MHTVIWQGVELGPGSWLPAPRTYGAAVRGGGREWGREWRDPARIAGGVSLGGLAPP